MSEQWREAIGRTLVERQVLRSDALHRFALAIGAADDDPDPALPHWAFFLPSPADDQIGEDGHPRRGGFLPAVTLPRRMFAGASIVFEAPLTIDADATLTSVVTDVTAKQGRSGELVFVEVDRTLEQAGTVRLRERQSYVYRDQGAPVPMPVPVPAATSLGGERWMPDEVNLFRFSAVTFNAHRIHYDRPYAIEREGYPALVIHGPFIAVKLAELARRDGRLARFAFRAEAPLFLGQPIVLQRGDSGQYRAVRCDGVVSMTAEVDFA